MSLLREIMNESAAAGSTSAHAIATSPGSLFGGGIIDDSTVEKKKKKKKPGRTMLRRVTNIKEGLGVNLDSNNFDSSDVISKINAAGKSLAKAKDTTAFALEDTDGNLIKVVVKDDQAEEFEKQLSIMLAGIVDDDDEPSSSLEIAEILYKLKDNFQIVDVEWPHIQTDMEEEQEVVDDGDSATPADDGGDLENVGNPDETNKEVDGDSPMGDDKAMDDDVKTTLSQVIDMMKSQAESQKAEADARAAEARAKEAEYSAQASASTVRKQEQIYDMEAAEKKKKELEKEASQQAKLARFQYDQVQDAEVKLAMEDSSDDITMEQLSELIMQNLAKN